MGFFPSRSYPLQDTGRRAVNRVFRTPAGHLTWAGDLSNLLRIASMRLICKLGRLTYNSRINGAEALLNCFRGVAQLGSALRSGRRGHRFNSGHPDKSPPSDHWEGFLIGLVCYQIGLANHCLPWHHHLPFTDALWTGTGSELIAERA